MNRSVNGRYGLRRNIVPSKRFEDYYVEGVSLSKKRCLRTRNTGVNGHSSTSQALLPLPISDGTYGSGGCSLVLPLKNPELKGALQGGDGGLCRSFSEPVFPSTKEGFEGTDRGIKQTPPCHLVSSEEQICTVQVGWCPSMS